jgi:hypothetical protein
MATNIEGYIMLAVQSFWLKKLWLALRRAYALVIGLLPYTVYVIVHRNGNIVYRRKTKWRFYKDLLVWRGQMVLAYLLSQGALGTSTSIWKIVASENSNAPDMSDDSGEPLANEFNPIIGTPVEVTYDIEPEVKVQGGYQTYAELRIKATITSDGTKTLRKIGIIDSNAIPAQNIITEDYVTPCNVVLNDEIEIIYAIRLG